MILNQKLLKEIMFSSWHYSGKPLTIKYWSKLTLCFTSNWSKHSCTQVKRTLYTQGKAQNKIVEILTGSDLPNNKNFNILGKPELPDKNKKFCPSSFLCRCSNCLDLSEYNKHHKIAAFHFEQVDMNSETFLILQRILFLNICHCVIWKTNHPLQVNCLFLFFNIYDSESSLDEPYVGRARQTNTFSATI